MHKTQKRKKLKQIYGKPANTRTLVKKQRLKKYQ